MRISDWSSDVCSSDLFEDGDADRLIGVALCDEADDVLLAARSGKAIRFAASDVREFQSRTSTGVRGMTLFNGDEVIRSEEHTSELQSLMRSSYAVFCLKKKNEQITHLSFL